MTESGEIEVVSSPTTTGSSTLETDHVIRYSVDQDEDPSPPTNHERCADDTGDRRTDRNGAPSDTDMIRRWKESSFAVGLTHATWADEDVTTSSLLRQCTPVKLTAWCCRSLPVGRVGNMVVLWQTTEWVNVEPHDLPVDDTVSSSHEPPNAAPQTQRTQRPKLLCVVGPYWMVLLGLTVPLISIVTFWTARTQVPDMSRPIFVAWLLCTAGLYVSLCGVACSNPGLLHRHSVPPQVVAPTAPRGRGRRRNATVPAEQWYWNDQALTFRPSSAKYDPECAAVIEQFDHTCPWTGTAIGRNNMPWFKLFVTFIVIGIVFNAAVLTLIPSL